ncbi:MAG: transcription termination factor Rho, partial [Pseudonocardiales bacterium]|nr:transcription termination factor Rho [Pseudonocardiales bacterium]
MSDTDTISTEQPTGEDAASAGAPAADTAADSGPANGTPTRRRAGLTGMVLAELRQLAGELKISGTEGLRKGDLISAIKEAQASSGGARRRPSATSQEQLPLSEQDGEARPARAARSARNGSATASGTSAAGDAPVAEQAAPAAEAS